MNRFSLKADTLFAMSAYLVLMVVSSLARLLLFVWNSDMAETSTFSEILMGFLVGLRFDLVVTSIGLLPMALAMFLPVGLVHRQFWKGWLMVIAGAMVMVALVEPVFYAEFHSRLNSVALQYMKEDAVTVLSMLINGTPFFTLLAVWLLCLLGLFIVFTKLNHRFSERARGNINLFNWLPQVFVAVLLLVLVIISARGGTIRSGAPLRWGDAVHSQNTFANHLALNGVYTFAKAAERLGEKDHRDEVWLNKLDNQKALEIARDMVMGDNETLLNPKALALYRETKPKRVLPENVNNIVIILMESFSSRFIAAEGNQEKITPYFDDLAKEGVLFTRAFSNGTHTHQGMFATFACFPNTPGNEYLMQAPEGNTTFSGYAAIMRSLGYKNNAYIYNGAFNWDNQEGFFGKQGITHFVGRDDMIDPVFIDPTWGVSDEDMFNRSLIELDQMNDTGKPFFAMLQTLSNHMPYAVPEKLQIEEVPGDQRMTALRYSDWALGKFFEAAKTKPWYNDTLFVLVGDHGFSVNQILTPGDLLRHHVPVLMIAPGLRAAVGSEIDKVMSQPDVVPTAISLFGKPFAQQCWGRNILALDENDPGFAIIKPSGNQPLVTLIEGSKALVKQPDLDPELFTFNLGPKPSATRIEEAQVEEGMYERLAAYLQTAMRSLYNHSVGDKSGLEPISE